MTGSCGTAGRSGSRSAAVRADVDERRLPRIARTTSASYPASRCRPRDDSAYPRTSAWRASRNSSAFGTASTNPVAVRSASSEASAASSSQCEVVPLARRPTPRTGSVSESGRSSTSGPFSGACPPWKYRSSSGGRSSRRSRSGAAAAGPARRARREDQRVQRLGPAGESGLVDELLDALRVAVVELGRRRVQPEHAEQGRVRVGTGAPPRPSDGTVATSASQSASAMREQRLQSQRGSPAGADRSRSRPRVAASRCARTRWSRGSPYGWCPTRTAGSEPRPRTWCVKNQRRCSTVVVVEHRLQHASQPGSRSVAGHSSACIARASRWSGRARAATPSRTAGSMPSRSASHWPSGRRRGSASSGTGPARRASKEASAIVDARVSRRRVLGVVGRRALRRPGPARCGCSGGAAAGSRSSAADSRRRPAVARRPRTRGRSRRCACAGSRSTRKPSPSCDGAVEVGQPEQLVGHLEPAVDRLDLVLGRGERVRPGEHLGRHRPAEVLRVLLPGLGDEHEPVRQQRGPRRAVPGRRVVATTGEARGSAGGSVGERRAGRSGCRAGTDATIHAAARREPWSRDRAAPRARSPASSPSGAPHLAASTSSRRRPRRRSAPRRTRRSSTVSGKTRTHSCARCDRRWRGSIAVLEPRLEPHREQQHGYVRVEPGDRARAGPDATAQLETFGDRAAARPGSAPLRGRRPRRLAAAACRSARQAPRHRPRARPATGPRSARAAPLLLAPASAVACAAAACASARARRTSSRLAHGALLAAASRRRARRP